MLAVSKRLVWGALAALAAVALVALSVVALDSVGALTEDTPDDPPIQGFFYSDWIDPVPPSGRALCPRLPFPPPARASHLFAFPGQDPGECFIKVDEYVEPIAMVYNTKILVFGGIDSAWTAAQARIFGDDGQMEWIKTHLGWDGICFDLNHLAATDPMTLGGLDTVLRLAQAVGLTTCLTVPADGPSQASGSTLDWSLLDWNTVDLFVPRLVGEDRAMVAGWPTYVDFWTHGGKTVHDMVWPAAPVDKVLWAVTADTTAPQEVMAKAPGSGGYAGWCYHSHPY